MRRQNILEADVPGQGMHLHVIPYRAYVDPRWEERSGLWIYLTAEEVNATCNLIASTPCGSAAEYIAILWQGHDTMWSCPIPWSTARQITAELEGATE